MKTLKSLFLLCAGLSFCACSSDDDGNQLPKGDAAITVKIALPDTRAIDESPYSGDAGDDKVELNGTIYVELTADSGTEIKAVDANNTATFYGISNPTKVEAYVNGGKQAVTNNVAINAEKSDGDDKTNYNMQADAQGVPAYGSVTVSSQNLTTQTEFYDGKNYRMYAANVTMEIPVARIEFAVKRTAASTKFSTLNLAGVYLDYILKNPDDQSTTNFYHKNDVDIVEDENTIYKTTATGTEAAILSDYEIVPTLPFIEVGTLPAENKVYAYNIYPGSAPHIKLWFNKATALEQTEYVVPYQYAVVNSYNSGQLINFEKGKIYRVTNLTLSDSNLSSDESGTDATILYGIDVTVEEAEWDVVDVNGSWTKP